MPGESVSVRMAVRTPSSRVPVVAVVLALAVAAAGCSGSKSGTGDVTGSGTGGSGRSGVGGSAAMSGARAAGAAGTGANDAGFDSGATTVGSGAGSGGFGGNVTAGAGATGGQPSAMVDAGVSPGGSGGSGGETGGMDASVMDASTTDAALADSAVDATTGMDDDDSGPPACVPLAKPLDVSSFPKCAENLCPAQDSVCVPRTLLQTLGVPTASVNLLSDCDATNKCVPTALASQAGRAILPSCVSLIGAEGRCLSTCVPQIAVQASALPKDTCTASDLCAPCYDPRTGDATGACNQGCDPGPTQTPKLFAHCCSDRGRCVPPAVVGAQAGNLAQDTCGSDTLCAPTELTDRTFKPKSCASTDSAEGRCVSTCLGGAIAQQRDRLPTAGCAAQEVCAPCFDPITGASTGACTINGDAPLQPAYRFDRCCDNGTGTQVGVCITAAMAGSQASMLRADSCASGRLCAPIKRAVDPTSKFTSCTGLGSGACVPSCILDPLQAGLLSRTRFCDVGELCTPCTTLGVSTGACD